MLCPVMQQVAVLHLEERCERAIEWALKIEPSINHLVKPTTIFIIFILTRMLIFPYQEQLITSLIFCILQVVSGGVASNQYVRTRLNQVVKRKSLQLVCPPPSLCTDNGKLRAPWLGLDGK